MQNAFVMQKKSSDFSQIAKFLFYLNKYVIMPDQGLDLKILMKFSYGNF